MALPLLAGLAVAKGVMDYSNSRSAARSARKLGQKNARRINMQTRENIRVMTEEQDKVLGTTRATMSASGFDLESNSNRTFLDDMEGEFRKQRNWTRMTGSMAADEALSGAQSTSNQIKNQGTASLVSGAMGAVNIYGQANDWWQS